MVAVTVGTSIGGGTPIAPDAEVDDRRAEVVVSLATGPLARVGYAKDLRTGRHTERDDVLAARATSVRVSGGPFPVNTDGELEEDVTDRSWQLRPSAWTAAVPT